LNKKCKNIEIILKRMGERRVSLPQALMSADERVHFFINYNTNFPLVTPTLGIPFIYITWARKCHLILSNAFSKSILKSILGIFFVNAI
jgi:hypothetical protein